MSPYSITGPTTLSFSGGRTSGYMLWKVLQEHGGALPAQCVVTFANTGKEMPETLNFVNACAVNWRVPIVWLEYCGKKEYKVVDYETASRNGEPFEQLIRDKKYLPNSVARICTVNLKIRTMSLYVKEHLAWDRWDNMIGLRADEQRRVSKIRGDTTRENVRVPLAEDGITVKHVGAFWDSQPFDLNLPTINGKAALGNCDLCYLKGKAKLLSIIKARPELAEWWARAETLVPNAGAGAQFRPDYRYSDLQIIARDQADMFDVEDAMDCHCTD